MKNLIQKTIALTLAISLLMQSFLPQKLYALTGGPQSPDFSNFESVSTSQMVDPFTGDFTFNLPILEVPGPNGGGYPISLSYHSGSSPEEEASWVGYGWTLNPGSITRNKQGFPDDANGESATYYNKIGKNWSIVGGTDTYLKAFNIPGIDPQSLLSAATNTNAQLGLSWQMAYHNKTGLSMEYVPYFNCNIAFYSANVSLNEGEIRYTKEMDPAGYISNVLNTAISSYINANKISIPKVQGVMGTIVNTAKSQGTACLSNMVNNAIGVSPYSSPYTNKSYSLYNQAMPTVLQDYQGFSISGRLGGYAYPTCLPIGYGGAVFASYTQQKPANDGISSHNYYGYIYSHNVSTEDDLMDYTIEKQDVYNMRDNYLPIPHSAADMFVVSGENIGGSFRAYSSTVGHFRPNYQHGEIDSYSFGAEVGLGVTNTATISAAVGVNIEVDEDADGNDVARIAEDLTEAITGGGNQMSVEDWNQISNCTFSDNQSLDEPYYFRFTGDMGGLSEFNAVANNVVHAELSGNESSGYMPSYSYSDLSSTVNEDENGETMGVSRASYIGYHTNNQMSTSYQRYSLRDDNDLATGFTRETNSQIGEFAISNKSGSHFVYALPVQASDEYEISIDVDKNSDDLNWDGRSIVYKSLNGYIDGSGVESEIADSKKLVGCYRPASYATSYLLTEITQPNYIDVTHDGPTRDDIGGWTKFTYEKHASDYHWRMPYRGLYYNPGNLADPSDDMGSFSSGNKEIYYLKSISTATHVAIFELSERNDGIEAPADQSAGASYVDGTQTLKKLDKITLYARNADGSPGEVLKRIYFKYDYLAFPYNLPNYDSGHDTNSDITSYGKLTLTKVWTEYANISNPTISPYQFEYSIPDDLDFPTKYRYEKQDTNGDGVIDDDDQWVNTGIDEYVELENYYDDLDQDPRYNSHASDRWGAYQANGETLDENMIPWIDQTPDDTFDPAAWQLKRIILPTGGQMIVQYEQDDYQYVQDRKAMAMLKLSSIEAPYPYASDNSPDAYQDGSQSDIYYVDLESIGLAGNNDAIVKMRNYIQSIMINGAKGRDPQKAYFKFLYKIDESTDAPTLDDCNSAFIDGYITLREVGIEDEDGDNIYDKLFVKLGSAEDTDESDWECPRDAAVEFFKTTRGNLSEMNADCERTFLSNAEDFEEEGINVSTVGSTIYEFLDHVSSSFTGSYTTICRKINPEYSYIRLPLPYEKKGGGLRVKRLLTYDPGIETTADDAMVYGHEYLYVDFDGYSSGIASNEPVEGGEENALINFLNKRDESTNEQVLAAGHDKSQFQGPLGESILPFPSVGYSRVLKRNIHSAHTHDGIQSFEYYTTKDYPFDKQYSYTNSNGIIHQYKGVSYSPLNYEESNQTTFGILSTSRVLNCWATQGYKFIINGMNGQPKKQSVYSGKWDDYNYTDSLMEVSSISYSYVEPGEEVSVLYNQYGEHTSLTLGRASEIIAESKKVSDETGTQSISIEFGVGFCVVPIPYCIPIPFKTTDQTHIYTHVTTQTDYFPPIVKSITKFQDGAYTTTNHLHFDKLTGDAIVSSSPSIYDQMEFIANGESTSSTHEGKYFSYNIPATFYYEGLGQKAGCENITIDDNISMQLNGSDVFIQFDGSDYCEQRNKFTLGDLIAVTAESGTSIWNVTEMDGHANRMLLSPSTGFDNSTFDGQAVSVKILQSGRANILTLRAGNITSYGEEFRGISDYVSIDENQTSYRDDLAEYLNEAKEAQDNGRRAPGISDYDEIEYISRFNSTTGSCSACEEATESIEGIASDVAAIRDLLTEIGVDESRLNLALEWANSNTDRLEFLLDYGYAYRDANPTDTDIETQFLGNISSTRNNRNRINTYLDNTFNNMNLSRTYTNTSRTTYLNNLFIQH